MCFWKDGTAVAKFVLNGVGAGFFGKGGETVYDKGQSFVGRTLRRSSDNIITPIKVAPVDITGRVSISGELENKPVKVDVGRVSISGEPVKVDVGPLAAAVALGVFAAMAALKLGEYFLGGGGNGGGDGGGDGAANEL